jgi:hypothetical protein
MILAALLFLSGLSISAVAIYYSVVGLTAIFSAAAIPIMIMGISLEIGKLVIASWVKAYWSRIPILMRTYAVTGVVVLMVITSLGIFGFLSKAHSDQTLVSGDVQSKIAVYDEKIKTEKENIEADRRALKQLDEAVDQILGRSTTETGADRAVAIRRSQQKERARLQAEILQSQQSISQLNDARAPIAAEVRKVEAEVGPIKYIAAFVYGDNPDASILERAVTWVIILIVIVFDPLAVVMLLAAQMTWAWYKNPESDEREYVASGSGATIDDLVEQEQEEQASDGTAAVEPQPVEDVPPETSPAYLSQPFTHFENLQPMPAPAAEREPVLETEPFEVVEAAPDRALIVDEPKSDSLVQELATELEKLLAEKEALLQNQQLLDQTIGDLESSRHNLERRIAQLEATGQQPVTSFVYQPEQPKPITDFPELQDDTPAMNISADPVPNVVERKFTPEEIAALDQVYAAEPEVTEVKAEVIPDVERPGDYITDPVANLFKRQPDAGFGTEFPDNPQRGDMFLRTDFRPTRLFKWNDTKWIEVNKATTDAYTYNDAYIQHLVTRLLSGEYTLDDLTLAEQQQVQSIIGGARG